MSPESARHQQPDDPNLNCGLSGRQGRRGASSSAQTALTAVGRLSYSKADDEHDCRRRFLDSAPLVVARLHPCGAMARLIDLPNDHRLPARRPAGFFVQVTIHA
jgi:hypothetical protein